MSKGIIAASAGAALLLSVPFIASWEGKSNDPYRDIVGIPTVCYGETRVVMRRYSDAECLAILQEGVKQFEGYVLRCTPSLKDRPYQLAAATSLTYNIGPTNYCRSTAARRFNQGRYKEGCEAFRLWNKAGGRVVKGLVNRREAEYKLCVTYLNG
jgi:lysozyme